MDRPRMDSFVCTNPPDQRHSLSFLGCIPSGMGRSHGLSDYFGCMEPTRVTIPHKLPGDGIGIPLPTPLSSEFDEQTRGDMRGQHLLSRVSTQTRRHSVKDSFHQSRGNSPMDTLPSDINIHGVYPGQVERPSGPTQSKKSSSPDRVDNSSPGTGTGLVSVGKTHDRPFRYEIQSSVTPIRVSDEGRSGHQQGCLRDVMGASRCLCLPSDKPVTEGNSKGRDRQTQTDPGSAILASVPLVSRPHGASKGGSSVSKSIRKDPVATKVRDRKRKSSVLKPDRLATIREGLAKTGLSKEAVTLAMKARRDGTNTNYNSKWLIWVRWCNAQVRKVDPLHPKPKHVADFLARLYKSRNLSHATLCNYRSAIASTIKAVRGLDDCVISNSHTVRLVLDGVKSEFPLKTVSPPFWDVFVVLKFLQSKTFEPLNESSWLQLSRKTLFLVWLACARRVSGIHALSGNPRDIHFSDKTGSCSLHFIPEFRAKNQDSLDPNPTIVIKSLTRFMGQDKESYSLCPVRVLKHYLTRSAYKRKNQRRLFLPLSETSNRDVTKTALSKWIRELIIEAYQFAKLPPPSNASKTHELRRISTSIGFAKNMSIQSIMKAAYWSSENTFIGHYLRDLRITHQDDTYGIDMVVAAGEALHLH